MHGIALIILGVNPGGGHQSVVEFRSRVANPQDVGALKSKVFRIGQHRTLRARAFQQRYLLFCEDYAPSDQKGCHLSAVSVPGHTLLISRVCSFLTASCDRATHGDSAEGEQRRVCGRR